MRRFFILSVLSVISVISAFSAPFKHPLIRSAIYSPVLVSVCGGSGSGFYWFRDSNIYFITAAHVLFKDTSLTCSIIILESHSFPSKNTDEKRILNLSAALNAGKLTRHPTQDIALVYIANVLSNGTMKAANYVSTITSSDSGLVPIGTFMPFKEVTISNDVYLLGYPKAIGIAEIPQLDYSQPLLRKGIVAGKNLKNNTIIVDCPSYPGNSGGPVLEIDPDEEGGYTIRVIGVLSEFIPFAEKWINTNFRYENISVSNSGYSVVIPMDYAGDLINLISK